MAEISVEKNSTIIFPAQFMTTVREAMDEAGEWVDGGSLLRGIEAYRDRTTAVVRRGA